MFARHNLQNKIAASGENITLLVNSMFVYSKFSILLYVQVTLQKSNDYRKKPHYSSKRLFHGQQSILAC